MNHERIRTGESPTGIERTATPRPIEHVADPTAVPVMSTVVAPQVAADRGQEAAVPTTRRHHDAAVDMVERKPIPNLTFHHEAAAPACDVKIRQVTSVVEVRDAFNPNRALMISVERKMMAKGMMGTVHAAQVLTTDATHKDAVLKHGIKGSLRQEASVARALDAAYGRDNPFPAYHVFDEKRNILVMDRVQGRSLEHYQAQHKTVPVRAILPMMRDLAGHLLELQERGFVMTDANPGNIRVQDGAEGPHMVGFYDHGAVLRQTDMAGQAAINLAEAFADTSVFAKVWTKSISPSEAAERIHVAAILAHLKNAMTGDAFSGEGPTNQDAIDVGRYMQTATFANDGERVIFTAMAEYLGLITNQYGQAKRGLAKPVRVQDLYQTLDSLCSLLDQQRG